MSGVGHFIVDIVYAFCWNVHCYAHVYTHGCLHNVHANTPTLLDGD